MAIDKKADEVRAESVRVRVTGTKVYNGGDVRVSREEVQRGRVRAARGKGVTGIRKKLRGQMGIIKCLRETL